MILIQDIVSEVMITMDIVKSESLGKGTFRSEKAAKQLGIEAPLLDSLLRSSWTVDTVIKAIQATPDKSKHPLLSSENRTEFVAAVIRLYNEDQEQ